MATIVFAHRELTRHLGRPGVAVWEREFEPANHGLAQSLRLLGQRVLGWMLLLFGGALVLTLWLLPLGLPVGLFGLALIAGPP